MPTLVEGLEQLKAELTDAERRLAAVSGDDVGDQRVREWLTDQIARLRRRIAGVEADASPPLGTV